MIEVKTAFPEFVPPMVASSVKEPFDDPDWLFETKLDGYRAITVIDRSGQVSVWSRNKLSLDTKFQVIHDAVKELGLRSTILDREVVALDDQGIPRFELLQKWRKRPTAPLVYYVFDLLWHNGRNWTGKNVLQRRNQLRKVIKPDTAVQIGDFIAGHGIELFRLARENGLEGIIAKRAASTYQAGKRSPDWLKIKARLQQEFMIGGFTEGKGSRKHFGALGAYENGKLRYFGHSGSGFSDKMIKEILKQLRPLFTDKSPFTNPPKISERIQWVKPELVCEVAFAEWTSDGQMRQTTFLGLRPDKHPKEVVLELAPGAI